MKPGESSRAQSEPSTPSRAGLRWALAWRAVLLLALGGLVLGWLLSRFETYQLYYPTPLRGEFPANWGLPFEDVRIVTEDGITLQAWWIPRPEPDAPLVINFHGNAGNREDRLPVLQQSWRAGISVLMVDYRGYGGSGGAPSEQGLYTDGVATYDWLATRYPGRPILLYGHSLGGAVAAQVALRRPAAGLMLESAFTSAPDMAERLYPVPGIRHLVRSSFDTHAAVRALTIPLLIVHGVRDEIVPLEMAQALYAASPSTDKRFYAVQNGRHNDTYLMAGEDYWRWVREFARR